jgi:hypothetical protein
LGWSFEPDIIDGNPDIVYVAEPGAKLELTNANSSAMYQMDVDSVPSKKLYNAPDQPGYAFGIVLYSIYAKDTVTITYLPGEGTGNAVRYESALYVAGRDREDGAALGGRTVGPDSADYAEWGIMVNDNVDFEKAGYNFIGWQVSVNSLISDAKKKPLISRLWFPGEFLPSVDFDVTFTAVYILQSSVVSEKTILWGGTEDAKTKYKVLAPALTFFTNTLSPVININTAEFYDNGYQFIIALPRGTYTLAAASIKISGKIARILLPAVSKQEVAGNINVTTVERGAIIADKLEELYISDNLKLEGNPIGIDVKDTLEDTVIGGALKRYATAKGYTPWYSNEDGTDEHYMSVVGRSEKYDFEFAKTGILANSKGNGDAIIAFPSGSSVGTETLYNLMDDMNKDRTAAIVICSYAFTNTAALETLNLNLTDLVIEMNAIYHTNIVNIVLPETSASINSECISGYQPKLQTVKFGPNDSSSYAVVEDGILYHGTEKETIIYVLPSAELKSDRPYIGRYLEIPAAVKAINDYALSSFDFSNVRSISAESENMSIDFTQIKGLPANFPIFVHDSKFSDNVYSGSGGDLDGRIQTYVKTINFKFGDDIQSVTVVYGEPLTIFDPEMPNSYGVLFDNPYYKFKQWIYNDKGYTLDATYYIGPDYTGSKVYIQNVAVFDASAASCWTHYPVEFHIYDADNLNSGRELNMIGFNFNGANGAEYTIDDLMDATGKNWPDIYLPGIESTFTADGVKYQFVGWVQKTSNMSFDDLDDYLWNSYGSARILPNGGENKVADNNGIYYALYDKVTDNLKYTLFDENGSKQYKVEYNANAAEHDVRIPYAKFNNGLMYPVTSVAANTFAYRTYINGEIYIGGAVANIGASAFQGVNADIMFGHKEGTNLYIGGNLTLMQIGSFAFADNSTVTSLTLPSIVASIGEGAFQNNSVLTTVTLSTSGQTASLISVGAFAFAHNTEMVVNDIVTLINNAAVDTFTAGDGIFMDTKIAANVIWKVNANLTTLLHAGDAGGKSIKFNNDTVTGDNYHNIGIGSNGYSGPAVNNIAGYAFAYNSTIKGTIKIAADVAAAAYAFANIVTGTGHVEIIDLQAVQTGNIKNIDNIHVDAFKSMPTNVKLSVTNGTAGDWQNKFGYVTSLFY